MLEHRIEQRLVKGIKKLGGKCLKVNTLSEDALPDRQIFLPGGLMKWVETKRPGKKPTPLQQIRIDELTALGFDVRVIDTIEQVDNFLNELKDAL